MTKEVSGRVVVVLVILAVLVSIIGTYMVFINLGGQNPSFSGDQQQSASGVVSVNVLPREPSNGNNENLGESGG